VFSELLADQRIGYKIMIEYTIKKMYIVSRLSFFLGFTFTLYFQYIFILQSLSA
ncbi:unnamed protein product, partial [marine sediment metagenome]